MARLQAGRLALVLCSTGLLAGCGENAKFDLFKNTTPGTEVTSGGETPSTTKLVERDVEVPEVFQATDDGLWDGRPSLGGVWVAHADVMEPERVIIRNDANGKFVIGALFKREQENPGPAFQVSSDAAAALGILAGAPGQLNVTALRRQEVPISGEVPGETAGETPTPEMDIADIEAGELAGPETIDTEKLDDPVELAAAALQNASPLPVPKPTRPEITNVVPTAASATPSVQPDLIDKPFIQIGLFSVEENARKSGDALRDAGILPAIVQEDSNGKPYWRVLAGPSPTAEDRTALLVKIKKLGYLDAYFVDN